MFSAPNPTSFLPGDYTIATLPSAVLYPKQYAWVTDLHDGQADRVISDGGFWKPVRPLATRTSTPVNGAVMTALVNAPTQILTGSAATAMALTFGTANAYPGAKFRVVRRTTGILSFLVAGTALAINGWADYEFDGTAWTMTASSGVLGL